MDKLKMHSPDITQQNIDKLLDLFPNCKTEKQDASGELCAGIDFDLLKQELSKNIVEGPQERYQLNWPGKKEALLTANAPIAKTLRPCREESVDFDTTENLFIEGDNLDALKLLQETYLGKVKMIYIDPPYNTGRDFIYADNFAESTDEYLQESAQKDEEGNRLLANTDSNGRFHSDWLSMMYSRLRLARNLLRDDGVIFISIDDCEVENLRKICGEIFGEENFVEQFVWIKKTNPPNNVVIGSVHEYVLAFAKDKNALELYLLPRNKEADKKYKNLDDDPRGVWTSGDLSAAAKGGRSTPSLLYKIENPFTGVQFDPPPGRMWIVPKDAMEKNIKDNRIWWGEDRMGRPKYKRFLSEVRQGISISTLLDCYGNNGSASKELNLIFDGSLVFETPKPLPLLKMLIEISSRNNDLVMDFFAGSGTFAHAALEFNRINNQAIRFICMQLGEPYDKASEAYRLGFENIAKSSMERIRRAGAKIKEESPEATELDTGFRVLKIDSSNMNNVHYTPDSVSKDDLFSQIEHIKTDRSAEDLLFQVMLDWGVDLSLPIRKETIEDKEVYFVNDDDLIACFDKDIDEALIKALAAKAPLRVVFRDDGFVSDSVKINVEQIFKQLAPATDIKAI